MSVEPGQDRQEGHASVRPWSVNEVLRAAREFLEKRGFDEARLDCELMLAHVLGMDRLRLYMNLDRPLAAGERDAFKAVLRRRAERVPVAYLLGSRSFWKYSFHVTPDVLIPRPETEFLVEMALTQAKERMNGHQGWATAAPVRILDIATGSGCIALSLGLELPQARVLGVDVSDAALEVARGNGRQLSAPHVEFAAFDLFRGDDYRRGERFDIVVSNPPYIKDGDVAGLPPDVRDHEPRLALGGGEDGLDCYRRLSEHMGNLLSPDAFVAVEIGAGQAAAVRLLFEAAGFRFAGSRRDYAGVERVLAWRWTR